MWLFIRLLLLLLIERKWIGCCLTVHSRINLASTLHYLRLLHFEEEEQGEVNERLGPIHSILERQYINKGFCTSEFGNQKSKSMDLHVITLRDNAWWVAMTIFSCVSQWYFCVNGSGLWGFGID